MKRKIIQIADSTQLISLPRKWAVEHNLQKGNELDVTINGDVLEISANGDRKKILEIEADLSNLTPFLADRFMARSYQKGYDKITIHFNQSDVIEAVRKKIHELLGFEILMRTHNHCVIQSITSQLDVDFKTLLRQAFLILMEMAESLRDGYAKSDHELLRSLFSRDYDVNKFCYFCLRSINKGYHNEGVGTTILYYQIEHLEDLGDEFKRLGEELCTVEPKNKFMQTLLNKTAELTRGCYDFFYTPTTEGAVHCINMYTRIKSDLEGSLESVDKSVIKSYFFLMNIIRILYHIPTMRLDSLPGMKK